MARDVTRSAITVVPLSISHWELVSELFATSPGTNACWCMWPRRSPGTHTTDESGNRAAMKDLLDSGQSPGLIGLVAGRAVGWCAVGPRDAYRQYEPSMDKGTAWAIPCLYVHREADRSSVARALIDAAVDLASENGADVVEGPPPYWLPGDLDAVTVATSTFLENGFETVGPGARMPELRRILRSDE